MFKILCVIPIFYSLSCHAQELLNFQELKQALNKGKNVRLVATIDKCIGQSSEPSITISTNLTSVMISSNRISASESHFTRNNPQHKNKSIFEFTTYAFNKSNKLVLSTQNLDPTSYLPLDSVRTFVCDIGLAAKLFTIS